MVQEIPLNVLVFFKSILWSEQSSNLIQMKTKQIQAPVK